MVDSDLAILRQVHELRKLRFVFAADLFGLMPTPDGPFAR